MAWAKTEGYLLKKIFVMKEILTSVWIISLKS
jgi:hypothetical protein